MTLGDPIHPVTTEHTVLSPNVRKLTRRQLTVLLILVSSIPPLFVISMVRLFPAPREMELTAEVRFEASVHRPRRDPDNPRILPSVTIINPTQERWQKIAVSINKDFFYYHPDGLDPAGTFTIPLEFFVTKSGNVAFQPGSEWVHRVTIYAQVPSGARAISENYFTREGKSTTKP
jgi:hypothetical protein